MPTPYDPTFMPMDVYANYEVFSDVTDFPGYHGMHCHDFFEFYVFFSGASFYGLDDQVIPLTPCTLVIVPPFHMHGIVGQKVEQDYERAWINISPAMIQTVSMDLSDLNDYFKQCVQAGKSYFQISREQAQSLRSIIQAIRDRQENQTRIGKWQNYVRVADFLSNVYNIVETSQILPKPVVHNQVIQAVLSYLNDHYTEPISIPELSRQFGISTSYMSRAFTAYTGHSVYDYVLYRRILLSKERICAGKPLTEIAYECGFNDYSCFLRAFTKLTGQSPSAYKKYMKSIVDL